MKKYTWKYKMLIWKSVWTANVPLKLKYDMTKVLRREERRERLREETDPMFPQLKGGQCMKVPCGDKCYVVARLWDGQRYETDILGPYDISEKS